MDTPLLGGINGAGQSVLTSAPTDQTEFFWFSEQINTPRTKLALAIASAGTTTFQLQVNHANKFKVGDLIRFSTEVVQVASIVDASNITVTRGALGTSALASIALGSVGIGMGLLLAEGSSPTVTTGRDRDAYSNYTRIHGPLSVRLTGTGQLIGKVSVNDEFTKQLMNRVAELHQSREQEALYGIKYASARLRTTGGLYYYLSNLGVVDSASTNLDVTALGSALQNCWGRGGVFDELCANPSSLSTLNAANASVVRTTYEDPRRGFTPVTGVDTEFGTVTIVRNRFVVPSHAFGMKRNGCARKVLRPLIVERLAKTGDFDEVMVVAEEGFKVQGAEHMALFTNLSYTEPSLL
jgi:hypothetical protein